MHCRKTIQHDTMGFMVGRNECEVTFVGTKGLENVESLVSAGSVVPVREVETGWRSLFRSESFLPFPSCVAQIGHPGKERGNGDEMMKRPTCVSRTLLWAVTFPCGNVLALLCSVLLSSAELTHPSL